MKQSSCLAVSANFVVVWLSAFFILLPFSLNAQEAPPQKPHKIEVKDGRLNVHVEDEDLSDVLKEIEKVTGVKVTISKELKGKKVSAIFENKDVEGALREVLRGYYYISIYSHDPANKEKKTLTEVKAKGDVIGSKQLKGKLITVEIPYGKGTGAVRAARESEGGSISPRSFAVDGEGKIYICDTWNGRVQVLSSTGAFLFIIPLRDDIFAEDIVVDERGYLYIYDGSVRKLYQVDKSGKVVTSVDVDNHRGVMLPLHFINNVIYFDNCDAEHCDHFVIGRVLFDSFLVGPSEEEGVKPYQEQKNGALTYSGKRYAARRFINGYNMQIDIIDKDGLTSKMLSLPAEGLLMNHFLGEDIKGNMHFIRARAEYEYQLYDVDKFDAEANYIGSAKVPSDHLEFWTAREIELNKNGNIYCFIPGEKKLTLHIFLTEDN